MATLKKLNIVNGGYEGGMTMVDKFEVWAYEINESNPTEGFKHNIKYHGHDLKEALEKMFELKNDGIKCIKLIWRP